MKTEKPIEDFVRDGHAWFRCSKCGSETTILKWDFDHVLGYPVINNEKTKSSIESFVTTHTLCKSATIQSEIFSHEG